LIFSDSAFWGSGEGKGKQSIQSLSHYLKVLPQPKIGNRTIRPPSMVAQGLCQCKGLDAGNLRLNNTLQFFPSTLGTLGKSYLLNKSAEFLAKTKMPDAQSALGALAAPDFLGPMSFLRPLRGIFSKSLRISAKVW
jgi:hypothetical protein